LTNLHFNYSVHTSTNILQGVKTQIEPSSVKVLKNHPCLSVFTVIYQRHMNWVFQFWTHLFILYLLPHSKNIRKTDWKISQVWDKKIFTTMYHR